MRCQEISTPLSGEVSDSEGQNPLLNSLIIINIFKNLGLDDLKSCRLVCPDWHDASLLSMRRCAKIYVDNENAVDELERLTWLHRVGNVRLNMCCNNGNILLTKFLDTPIPLGLRELTITCLNVTYGVLAFLSYFSILEDLTISCPERQKGYPKCVTSKSKFNKERNSRQLFSKLKRFVCLDIPIVERGTITQVLSASPNLIEIVTNVPAISNFVWRTLGFWSQTLESLEIGYIQMCNSIPSHSIMALSKLRRLNCAGGNIRCPDSTWAPNLEVAVFNYSTMDVLFPVELDSTSLKTLRIENPYIAQWAGFTSERFPFLKILNFTWMTQTLFRMVCQNLKTLEELHVGPEISDSTITGLPRYKPHIWQALVEAVKQKRKFTVGNYQKYACLVDLPRLKRITITGNSRLTEACFLLGLVHCKSLDTIEIDKIPEISMASIHAVADQLPQLKILNLRSHNLRDSEAYHAITHLNKKMPNCVVQLYCSS